MDTRRNALLLMDTKGVRRPHRLCVVAAMILLGSRGRETARNGSAHAVVRIFLCVYNSQQKKKVKLN
jgi:hypothetical protein